MPESVGVSSEKLDILKKELHKYVDDGKLAGIQTAILRKDKLIHFDSYGYADIESEKLLDTQSIFRIFSMTKPITSVGLMMLYEQGKFQLDDPLHLYIPEFKNMTVYDEQKGIIPAKNSIKIIDLLRHSSGVSYGRGPNNDLNSLYAKKNLGNSRNLRSFIEKISKLPLAFEPGTNYEYSYSTDICGYLIEVLSGQPINEYLQEKVLIPLKMQNTYFQLPKEKIQQLTTGYHAGTNNNLMIAELPKESMFANDVSFFRAGGGLVSTTNDYIKFCRMLLNKGTLYGHQILKPGTIDLMTKDHLSSVRKYTPRLRILSRETGFGLGFSIAAKEKGELRGVYGWGGAVGTYFRIDPEQDLAYVLMIQLSPYKQLNLRETFQELVNNSIIRQETVKPILLDKSMLSGVGLKQVNLKDEPNRKFFQGQIYRGKELSVYMVSSNTATKYFDSFPIEEFVYLMNGQARLEPKNGLPYMFRTGDFIIGTKGFEGHWGITGGNDYHLELSVISNKRAASNEVSPAKNPFKIDKEIISGLNIDFYESDVAKEVVFSGLELEISVEAERPRVIEINNSKKEKLIHVLGGLVAITPKNSETQTFYTGDIFILPKHFTGTWKSSGHSLFRFIKIIASR